MKCDRQSFQQHSLAPFNLVLIILISIYPLFCLLYAVNVRELRESISVSCVAFNKQAQCNSPHCQTGQQPAATTST